MTPNERVAKRVAEVRRRRGWTAEQLAQKCREIGAENFTTAKVNNIETRRSRVTVDELLILARALDVAPVNLVIPPELDPDDRYGITPQVALGAGRIRQWFRGIYPWPNGDRHIYLTETAVNEWIPPPGSYNPVGIDHAEHLSSIQPRGAADEGESDGR